MKKNKKHKNNYTLLFVFFLGLYLLSIPYWVMKLSESGLFGITEMNSLGDALGGITSPIIGIGGIILTFLAFYVQYSFNLKQSEFFKQEKIDRKIDEYSRYLEKVCFIEGPINTSVIAIGDRAAQVFNMIDINNKHKFSFENQSLEKIFLNIVHLNVGFNKQDILKKNNNVITGALSFDQVYVDEQITRKIQVYHKFCQFLNLLQMDFENSNISEKVTYDILISFIKKFEISYPMCSFRMSDIFILYYSLKIKNEKVLEVVHDYYKSSEDYSSTLKIINHSIAVYIKP